MKTTSRLLCVLGLGAWFGAAALAQGMLQYGTAAATGAAAGTAMGKSISDALSGALGPAATPPAAIDAVEAEPPASAKDYRPVSPAATMPAAAPSTPAAKSARKRIARPKPVRESAPAVALVPAVGDAPPVLQGGVLGVSPLLLAAMSAKPALAPLSERLQRIEAGSSRDDLKRILGAPASRVTIPADRDVSEIYYYRENGQAVATVRLEAGTVTQVRLGGI